MLLLHSLSDMTRHHAGHQAVRIAVPEALGMLQVLKLIRVLSSLCCNVVMRIFI